MPIEMDTSKYSDLSELNDYCGKVVKRFKFNIDLLERKYADRPTSGMVICFDPNEGDKVEFDPDLCTSINDKDQSKLLKRSYREIGTLRGTSIISAPEIDDSVELKSRDIARYKRVNKMFARLDAIDGRRSETPIHKAQNAMPVILGSALGTWVKSVERAEQSVAQASRVISGEGREKNSARSYSKTLSGGASHDSIQQTPKKSNWNKIDTEPLRELTSMSVNSDGWTDFSPAYLTRIFVKNLSGPDDESVDIPSIYGRLAQQKHESDFADVLAKYLEMDWQ